MSEPEREPSAVTADNEDLLHRSVAAFNEAMAAEGTAEDFERFLEEFFDPEVEYVNAPDAVDPGERRGHAGMRRVWANWRDAFVWMRVGIERVVPRGDRLAATGTIRVLTRGVGAEMEMGFGQVVTYRNGRSVRWEMFNDPDQALRAIGIEADG